jgi:hypothetical protein
MVNIILAHKLIFFKLDLIIILGFFNRPKMAKASEHQSPAFNTFPTGIHDLRSDN